MTSGSKNRLQLSEGRDYLVAEHLRQQFTAGLPVTMLTRERAAVLHHEICGALGEVPVAGDAVGAGERERVRVWTHP